MTPSPSTGAWHQPDDLSTAEPGIRPGMAEIGRQLGAVVTRRQLGNPLGTVETRRQLGNPLGTVETRRQLGNPLGTAETRRQPRLELT
ncbi:hypothetical protein [Dactylosporangium sp. CS-033363]|uniref:hypothetical protein n=1 Tax=Dactylosporangium sp. CS-033363 TaxID=3239935 RepID=UPI003D8F7660